MKLLRNITAVVIIVVASLISPLLLAENSWQLSLALGAGQRTNPVVEGKNTPIVIIPQVNFQGARFFIQNLDFGYSVVETKSQQLSFLLTPSYDQVFFNRWDSENILVNSTNVNANSPGNKPIDGNNFLENLGGSTNDTNNGPNTVDNGSRRLIPTSEMHKRRMAALAGVEYSINANDVITQVQVLQEITGYYNGLEVRIAFSKNVTYDRNTFKATLGANWQSETTLDYFYGIRAEENPYRKAYTPSAGASALLRLDWSYNISANWSLKFLASYRKLSDPIRMSPIIEDNKVITAFAGGVYHF
jgi:MipA family protein